MRGVVIMALTLLAAIAPAAAQEAAPERAVAADLRDMCGQDRGRLWGATLCGPVIVVDPASRAVWASDQDQEGILDSNGDGWTGVLPAGVPIANTSVEWAGVRWIMLMGPLPANQTDRRVLVAHEAWHRVQDQIGLAAADCSCAHLETERGRTLMRAEMRALATALRSRGTARRDAAKDALALRAERFRAFPDAFSQEAALDRNEGLAAYTGVRLGAGDGADIYAARTLDSHDTHNALARAYAYATGPAYGLLLDEFDRNWRGRTTAYTPADLLTAALNVQTNDENQMWRAFARYGGPAIATQERNRAERQMTQREELRQRFAVGPRIELPLRQIQFEFDPNAITPIDGLGSVYGQLTLRDVWGEFQASEGALISPDFTSLIAAAPSEDGLSGPGWRLTLNPQWRITPALAGGVRRVILLAPEAETGPPPLQPAEDPQR